MASSRKQRRQQHRTAWNWKQTNSWYFTQSGTKKRVALYDEKGERIRGKENNEAAQLALARIKVADEFHTPGATSLNDWKVAKVCDLYLSDLH